MKTLKIFQKIGIGFLLCLLLVTFVGAKRTQSRKSRVLPMTSIHIVDRNGFAETISNKDRLNQFQNVEFLKSTALSKSSPHLCA